MQTRLFDSLTYIAFWFFPHIVKQIQVKKLFIFHLSALWIVRSNSCYNINVCEDVCVCLKMKVVPQRKATTLNITVGWLAFLPFLTILHRGYHSNVMFKRTSDKQHLRYACFKSSTAPLIHECRTSYFVYHISVDFFFFLAENIPHLGGKINPLWK